ncbi:hypothetical protein G7076_04175 [Sphingomonas sp. HDW15A]|uniref:hypothetical protein n=1 Tax=Sphingomonas sp. HDW15A TaxID=2714942 RepID=UPI0014093CCD|nr:hypothetical protein [Sphingomonas sp. HDW15A]QIK95770.1 hypothetical protein G7076_04175 [Sphingomonas sp. HDW15A]
MPSLSVSNLEAHELSEAYPLIRCLAGVETGQWINFAKHLLEQGGGVLAARAEDRRIHGVAGYVVGSNLRYGEVLRIEALVTLEFSHTPLVRDALSAAIDELADRMGCAVVVYNLDARGLFKPGSKRRRALEQLGLFAESVDFVRRLTGPV